VITMTLRCPVLLLFVFSVSLLLILPAGLGLDTPPQGLQATVGSDHVDLNWQTVPEAQYYLLYRGDQLGMSLLANVSHPFTSYHDGGLEDGSSFTYYVTAVSAENESSPSNSVSVTVPLKESQDVFVPVLAIVLSVIAIQICAIMIMATFKGKMRLK